MIKIEWNIDSKGPLRKAASNKFIKEKSMTLRKKKKKSVSYPNIE